MGGRFIVDYKALGDKIRQKRQSLGLTQEKISESIELSESFYSRVERGDRVLSVETLVKIANYYDLSLDYLLLDSTQGGDEDRLAVELDNVFRDKSPAHTAYLLDILKVLAANMDKLYP